MNQEGSSSIFVIENDRLCSEYMHDMFTQWGYTTLSFTSLDGAMDAMDNTPARPDLLVVDLNLDSENSGLEAIQAIRAKYGLSKTNALIATGDIYFRAKSCPLDNVRVLYKPVRPELFRKTIQSMMDMH